jgi:hypothetical protein
MKYVLLFSLCLFLTRCDSNEAKHQYEGFYSWGFEVTGFSPCGSDEVWWTGGEGLVERYNTLGVEQYQEVYAVLVGTRSDTGEYGHLGAYDREFDVTRIVEMRLKRPGDCE